MNRTFQIPKHQFRTGKAEVNKESGTIRMSVSSDEPYRRYDWRKDQEYYEVLSHDPKDIDMSRMSAGTPLLFNHKRDIQIGRNMGCEIKGGKMHVDAQISKAPDVESYRIKIDEGILVDTSIGYEIADQGTQVGMKDGIPILRFKWLPYEASMVTIPADITVGNGREREASDGEFVTVGFDDGEKTLTNEKSALDSVLKNENKRVMATDAPVQDQPKINVVEERNAAVAAERKRVNDITELSRHFASNGLAGRKIDTTEVAEQFVRDGKTVEDFQNFVIRGNFKEAKPVDVTVPEIGMNAKEKRDFSFLRAILSLGTGRGLSGLEKEASEAHAKLVGRECGPHSFYAPMDVMSGPAFSRGITREQLDLMNPHTRALFSNVYSGAGAFVGTELIPSLIELLRNQMAVVRMGARTISGLKGNVAFPRQTGGATASWLAEDSTITATQQVVGQLNLTPHKLAAATAFTEQLAMQSSIDAENFVRQDLMAVTAIARDLAAINGSGSAGQPLGILNTSGLSTSVTLSAAQSMTYANAVQFETNVALNNAVQGKLGYLTTPTVKNNAKLIAEISAANSVPVWKNDSVNGYPAFATNQVPTATSVIFGNWDDLLLADWADSNFFVDPYSLSLQGQIRVINRLYCDNGVRHATSFSVSTN